VLEVREEEGRITSKSLRAQHRHLHAKAREALDVSPGTGFSPSIFVHHAQGVPPSTMLCFSHINQLSEFARKKLGLRE